MSNLPFDAVGLSAEDIDRFNDTYQTLKAKFNIQFTGKIDFRLNDFEVFNQYQGINVRNSFVIKQTSNDCYILFIDAHSKKLDSKTKVITDHYACQTWALAYLKQDFGRVMIRPETLTDKIIELIHPIELDFAEDKAFSDTFYVLINDHQKAVAGINRNFRNAVMDIRENDFLIEIVGHTLLIGSRKPVAPEISVYLAEFVVRVCSLC